MPVRELGLGPRQALEMVLYIAAKLKQVPNRKQADPDIHEVLKIRYFADKIHLSRYGFPASGDKYVAMEFGPVASFTYDLLKVARGTARQRDMAKYGQLVKSSFEVENGPPHRVFAKRDADTDFLAPSDIEALDEAIAEYGKMTFDERTEFSHDPAWKAAWKEAGDAHRLQATMPLTSIASTLPNADQVLSYLQA